MSLHGRSSRGRPVWQALALLMALPLVAAGIMSGVTVESAGRSADEALRAEQLVRAVELVDAARRSLDAEVLPTLLLGLLSNDRRAGAAGFHSSQRAVLLATEPVRLGQIRQLTDTAIDAVAGVPATTKTEAVLAQVRSALQGIRSRADQGTVQLQDIADSYPAIATMLSSVQRAASAEAISAGLNTDGVAALQDLDHVVELSVTASRQLAELFASRILPEPGASSAREDWVATWGAYTHLVGNSVQLSTPSTRVAWTVFQNTSDVTTFSTLLNRQALDPHRDVLTTGALPDFSAASGRRDDAIGVVLDYAAGAVTLAASFERAEAVSRRRLMVEVCLALAVLSLLDAGFVARWLATSMRSLATGAQQVSQGHLVDVRPQGPRELRQAAHALSSAVAGLRRVQEQARAVVAGDLHTALRQQPLPGPLGEVVQASVEQIVEAFQAREVLREELTYQANHDALTGLSNRAQALRHLSAVLDRRRGTTQRVGLLFIDLDGFKAVNDTHGHAVGDVLLCEVAQRLLATVRSEDRVGRLGGDEFVITISTADDIAGLVDLAERIIQAISPPVDVDLDNGAGAGRIAQAHVEASLGITVSTDASTADALLAEADTAAYRAKRLGRGRVEVFDDALRAEMAEQAGLQHALRQALDDAELGLHYQPVVSLATGDLVGYEALARWSRAGIGPVPPDVFVAVAETSTLVCDLGRWVLAEATAQMAIWRKGNRAGFGAQGAQPTIAVNLSGRHLADPKVMTDVADALTASGLPPELLVLEITETVLTNIPQATRHLQQLRALGVRVAIDDFGTGFTSISALSTTPADILKIDRSFVATDEPGHHELATLIARAAHTFGLRVVVEGIETPAQLARARADGCEDAQGYLFSRPLPAAAVEELSYPLPPNAPATATATAVISSPPAQRQAEPEWRTA